MNHLLELRPALNEAVADRRWDAWLEKYPTYIEASNHCVALVQSLNFWRNVENIMGVCKPFVDILHMVETDKFVFGKVYWRMSEAIQASKDHQNFDHKL